MKTHWLFGRGPDKVLDFKREVDEETDCGKCLHREVCGHDMEKRCENYVFGTSEHGGCQGCLHKYTRYDKDAVPCFSCPWFVAGAGGPLKKDAALTIELFGRVKTWVASVADACSRGEPPDANTGTELTLALREALSWTERNLDTDQREALAAAVDATLCRSFGGEVP